MINVTNVVFSHVAFSDGETTRPTNLCLLETFLSRLSSSLTPDTLDDGSNAELNFCGGLETLHEFAIVRSRWIICVSGHTSAHLVSHTTLTTYNPQKLRTVSAPSPKIVMCSVHICVSLVTRKIHRNRMTKARYPITWETKIWTNSQAQTQQLMRKLSFSN